jgi:hypothetical protein
LPFVFLLIAKVLTHVKGKPVDDAKEDTAE